MSRFRKIVLGAAAALALIVPSGVLGAVILTPAHENQDRIIIRGAAIRLGRSVYVHDAPGHAAIGITGLDIANGCDVRVFTDQPDTGDWILSAIAEEDETLSRLNIEAGVSGGNAYATILLYRNGVHLCARDPMFGTNANVWLQLIYLKRPEPS